VEGEVGILENFLRVEKGEHPAQKAINYGKLSFHDFTLVHVVFHQRFLTQSIPFATLLKEKSKVGDRSCVKLRHEI
jgi:hypothetical protein